MIIDKNFSPLMEKCFQGRSFSYEETKALMHGMLEDTLSDVRISAVLTAFRFVSLTKENILAIIESCKENAVAIGPLSQKNIVDCGGTGGDSIATIHISTMSSLVAASAGAHVAKFSGKSLSSKSGSSSVLRFLDIQPVEEAEEIERGLKQTGIVFLNAASFYPMLKNLSDIRKTLAFKTIIDLIFPLANPIPLYGQVVGVYQEDVMPLIAECLKELGRKRAIVAHGHDGLDEISVCAPTTVAQLDNGKITQAVWKPSDFGMKTHDIHQLQANNIENSAQILIDVLKGNAPEAIMNAVEINAAAILWCADQCSSLQEGLNFVRQSISTGKAIKTFENWKH